MRKILFAAFAGVLFVSCNDTKVAGESKDNSQEQKNIAAMHVVDKAFQTGDVSGIDSVVADDFLDHTDRGDMKGKDSLKAMIKGMGQWVTDMKSETIKEFADGDEVFSLMKFSGNSTGAMMPAGPFEMHSIERAKFRDGKIIEHWTYGDAQETAKFYMQMMESMSKPGANMNMKDSTKTK